MVNVENIEERFGKKNLNRVTKKRDKGLSQEHEKDRTVQYKKRKESLPKIISPDMMDICEVRDECPDGTSPVVMGDFLYKNSDEIHREIYEHDK